jgi:formylglycine-generating enzyme required for sulfatase activity
MSHIFISYSRKNQPYARRLADHLLARGFDVWIDDKIDFGDRWHRVIFKAIDECAALIVIMTPDARDSNWVEKEYLYADELKKPVFPLLLEGVRFPYFVNRQYVDARPDRLPGDDFTRRLEQVAPRKQQGAEISAEVSPSAPNPRLHGGGRGQTPPAHIDSKVSEILPPPFAWVEIPEDKQQYLSLVDAFSGSGGAVSPLIGARFVIAKYPITNAQYNVFVEAGGYREERWWTPYGWQIKRRERWTQPRQWGDPTWNRADHPVVGVSWYEAVAFCLWLTKVSGETIWLPTEEQWQRAAAGDQQYRYPWGDEWVGAFCNNSVPPFRSSYTTPVTEYEGRGSSPFGVVDMAGNLFEWCLTAFKDGSTSLAGTDARVLRGGSWMDMQPEMFSTQYRVSADPATTGSNDRGFRIVRA